MLLPFQGVNAMTIRNPGCRFACPGLCAYWAFSPCIIGGTSTIQASLIVFGLHDNSARALSAAKLCRKNIDFEIIKAVNNQRVRKE